MPVSSDKIICRKLCHDLALVGVEVNLLRAVTDNMDCTLTLGSDKGYLEVERLSIFDTTPILTDIITVCIAADSAGIVIEVVGGTEGRDIDVTKHRLVRILLFETSPGSAGCDDRFRECDLHYVGHLSLHVCFLWGHRLFFCCAGYG